MIAATTARNAYAQPEASVKTPRATEYELLARITRSLRRAADEQTVHYAAFANALHDNRTVWTRLAASAADPENTLPDALRAQIFYLGEFVAHHSRKVLSEDASIEILIEINSAIMAGLSTQRVLE